MLEQFKLYTLYEILLALCDNANFGIELITSEYMASITDTITDTLNL